VKGIAGKIPQIVDDNSGGRQLHVLYGVIWKLRGAKIENCNTNSSQVHRSTIQKDRAHNDPIRLIHYSPTLIHGHQPSRQTPTLQSQNQSVWLKFHQRQDVKTQEGPKERMPQQDRAV